MSGAPISRSQTRYLIDATRAELSKISSLPATWLTLAGTLALAAVLAYFFASHAAQTRSEHLNPLDVGLAALPYAQAGVFVFGVIISCSEYVGGQIRTTLTAIPRRGIARLAATLALVVATLPAAALLVATTLTVTALILGDTAHIPDAGIALRSVVSATIYLTLMVVFSAAIGSIVRRALPAAGGLVLYLVIASPLLLTYDYAVYLPDIAGYTLWFSTAPDNAPSVPVAWLILCAWTLSAYVVSVILARRRDS